MTEQLTEDAPSAANGEVWSEHPARRTLIFVVSEDWYFVSHRLPMARAARDAGYRVIVATRLADHAELIRAEGMEPVAIPMNRAGTSLRGEARTTLALMQLFKKTKPAIVHNVSLKSILTGGLAGLLMPEVKLINGFTGLGSLLGDEQRRSLLRTMVVGALRRIGASPRVTALVQNEDDRRFLVENRLAVEPRIQLIPGSGVDVEAYQPKSPLLVERSPRRPIALMVARLLRDKGVRELIIAARELHWRGVEIDVWIAGDRDPANPNSMTDGEIATARAEGVVRFLGHRRDVADLWRQVDIAVLPSYREGLPKSLLEAAASGLPLVTTDVPGCRDLVPEGETGVLLPPRDPGALADALERLAGDLTTRLSLGQAARLLVERRFSDRAVGEAVVRLYDHVLSARAEPA